MQGVKEIHNFIQRDNYCVYGLICPVDLSIKYIGCTTFLSSRIAMHYGTQNKKKTRKQDWINFLKENNLRFIPVIFKGFEDRDEAWEYERALIIKHSDKLLNQEVISKQLNTNSHAN